MTGWQCGPLASAAGHDLGFIAVTGVQDRRRPFHGGRAIEQSVYAQLLKVLDLDLPLEEQHDRTTWPPTEAATARFRARTQKDWIAAFAGTDSCVAPVRSLQGALDDPHLRDRRILLIQDGFLQAAPAPCFSGTAPAVNRPPESPGVHTREVLAEWGVPDVEGLLASGAAIATYRGG